MKRMERWPFKHAPSPECLPERARYRHSTRTALSGRSRSTIALAVSVLFLISFLISGCTVAQPTSKEPKTLKVLSYSYQFNEFAALYSITHDDVELSLIRLDEKIQELYQAYDQKIRENPEEANGVDVRTLYDDLLTGPDAPDVVIVDEGIYRYLMQKGELSSLDGYIQKDKFDLNGLAPVVLEALRSPDDGAIYGLSPGFISTVLAYNKDRFDAMGVPYPEDGLTWDELFTLAESVAGDKDGKPYYGLSTSNSLGMISGEPYQLIEFMLKQQGKGLTFPDDGSSPAFLTPEREALWGKMKDLIQRNIVARPYYERMQGKSNMTGEGGLPEEGAQGIEDMPYPPDYGGPFADDDFISGRSAMQLMSYYSIRQIIDIQNNKILFGGDWKGIDFSWDIATFPTAADHSEAGAIVNLTSVYAINANASQPALAWDFIQFVHSDKVMKAKQQTDTYNLFSRVKYNEKPEYDGLHMEAFWSGKPLHDTSNDPLTGNFYGIGMEKDINKYYQAYDSLRQAFKEMLSNNLSPKEALEKAQQTYNQMSNEDPTVPMR
ncbi:MAG: N-Acetyl-D-glucosamine ABC transport system, sugar-binding protein [Candidatus Carbobacillus altaicus]|uniref:N-Acetyl-D-glucosamine ABC transport system, sugar-binding protein n=1 Tax=Candidatus Carbonibacillus altaicus TaxID=2163959 RepID=A0A2R6Y4N3_9BACL|nr:MAG: N-Acetyl-D-glucosamine ABC transport system, sugar-binding protein [Candidatus Carbobacillus altaicus]